MRLHGREVDRDGSEIESTRAAETWGGWGIQIGLTPVPGTSKGTCKEKHPGKFLWGGREEQAKFRTMGNMR